MIHTICFGLDHVAVVVHEASEQTKFNVLSLSVEEAEARGILAGLHLADELKIANLKLSPDSVLAVNASNSSIPNKSQSWSICKEIAEAGGPFPVCSISHNSRKLNSLAHSLACIASKSGLCKRWSDPVPADVAELALQDVVNIGYE